MNFEILSDEREQAELRYVCVRTETRRYDLILMTSESLNEKNEVVLIDYQGSRYTKIHKNKIEDSEYLAHAFNVNEYESEEIYAFLKEVLE
ncbi:SAV0927 family protein [Aquisalibacillus elongatus]|uniref:DUF3055 family protein n=1 Tax=Aquisalibacillus elongatus TaxID=485577 RepID=A0A3N5AYJ5_9BACI|nr:SAV0927 family protein [Aquisalibacillus elongatus]RPF50326.1 DUF3055 family protein [Aquisalibacillus elongatus]